MALNEVTFTVKLPEGWAEDVAKELFKSGDAACVTRCRDCKHWHPAERGQGKCFVGGEHNMGGDAFCSHGELKGALTDE